ncbi:Filament-like plant protein 3 [Citrus sinensis]|uniref:Filament-like plant protein 3 n=1 Tax=Citrus sinensis TaxID=2711 RepID=A0ACB8JGU8_CITSI|nr:Filament-like plant protein 3 [Citrus sinensis]
MDRRSWLWRRKSGGGAAGGETESSGSVSSLSERFSDDQTHSSQSSEATSKAPPLDEVVNDSVKTLTEKLSAALLNVSAKEDLVKQHAKVAEEAVSGWEKAENELSTLKQQLKAASQKNSALENRVSHLDGALKECVRQLRQAREEQEQRIQETVSKQNLEWESKKSELESKLVDLQKKLQTAKSEAAASADRDLCSKLEAAEKQNSALKLELLSLVKELELRIVERDLSTKAAETASKQHLESIKKLAKVEAECLRLKAVVRKASPNTENKSFTPSSIYVGSFTDSQSDNGERLLGNETDNCKISDSEVNECEPNSSTSWASALAIEPDKNVKAVGRNVMVPSVDINLMDDFLEMERLAALPDTESRSFCVEVGPASDQPNADESSIKAELEVLIHRTAELEEELENMRAEKSELEMDLKESQRRLETSQNQLKEAELKLEELETQLAFANKSKQAVEVEMKAAIAARGVAESKLSVVEAEMKTQLALVNKSKQAAEEEVKSAKSKKEAAESRLRAVEAEMETLRSKVISLEDEVEKERALSEENIANFQKSKDELSKVKHEIELQHEVKLQYLAGSNQELKINQEELAVAASKFAECQKTIASLGRQLRSLVTLDDFLIDSEKPLEHTGEGKNGGESWNLQATEFTFVA